MVLFLLYFDFLNVHDIVRDVLLLIDHDVILPCFLKFVVKMETNARSIFQILGDG